MYYVERYLITFIRVYLGAFNLASGLDYFILWWPQPVPADPVGATFMHVTVQMGLFQTAKVIEIVAGFLLVCDIWVPFALVLLFPITAIILVMDTFVANLLHVVVSGARNFAMHVILLAAYAKYLFPLAKCRATIAPLWRNWRAFFNAF